jgi:serine/threonine protein kinase
LSTSTETRIPTQTFLLPGQQFCIGLPWERADLPTRGLPSLPPKLAAARLTLRDEKERADPCEGWELGACRVLRRLSDDSARTLLAVRGDETQGNELVVMRKLELPDVLAREARNHAEWAARYSHPNLARVFPCEEGDEGVFWVTQLTSGATLAEVAALMRKQGQGVPLGLTLAVVQEAARALAELHSAGAAHGLIRDQSIAVTLEGTAQLLDTGLFRCLAQGPSWLEVREVMGPYFAPEQLLEGRLPDAKTDVYSLGVVLYEGLTGEQVRRGKTFEQQVKLVKSGNLVPPSRLNVAVGAALDEVLQRALAVDRSQRYTNAREFASALGEAASAFMWRPALRSQFVTKHFDERRRQDEALKEMLAHLPPPESIEPEVELEVPAVRLVEPTGHPEPSRGAAIQSPQRAPRRKNRKQPKPTSRTLAPLLGMLAALIGYLAATVQLPSTPKPAAPIAVVKLAPVVLELREPMELEVERVILSSPALFTPAFASIDEPLPVITQKAPSKVATKAKLKKSKRRSRDEAPVPPWLVKRGRR